MIRRNFEHLHIRNCIAQQSYILSAEIDTFSTECGVGPIQLKRYGDIVYRHDGSILFLYKRQPQLLIHAPAMDEKNRVEQRCTRYYE